MGASRFVTFGLKIGKRARERESPPIPVRPPSPTRPSAPLAELSRARYSISTRSRGRPISRFYYNEISRSAVKLTGLHRYSMENLFNSARPPGQFHRALTTGALSESKGLPFEAREARLYKYSIICGL